MAVEVAKDRFELVFAVLLVAGVVNTAVTAGDLADYRYDIDYSEGFFIEDTRRFMETGELYPEPALSNGFESVKYPPVFYLVFGLAAEIAGYSFLTGRMITLLSTAASTAAIYLIAREKSGGEHLLTPFLFLIPYLTVFTGLTVRTDMLALALSLGGLYLVLDDRLYAALPLFILAALTKQVFISGFLASMVYLVYERGAIGNILEIQSFSDLEEEYLQHRELWNFAGIYTVAGFLSIGILQLIYPHFIQNVFAANMGGFEVRYDLLNWLHLTFLPVFGLAAYYIYIFRDRLLGSYLVFSTLVMLFQMTRGGAWVHSAIQPFAAAVMCCGVLHEKLRGKKLATGVMLLLIAQLLLFLYAPFVSGTVFDLASMDDRNRAADARISEEVERRENVYTEHAGYLVANGEKAPVEIWGMYEQYASGRISRGDVKAFFRRQNYTSIVTYKRLYNLPIRDYLKENYRVVDSVERRDMLLNREEWRIYRWTG